MGLLTAWGESLSNRPGGTRSALPAPQMCCPNLWLQHAWKAAMWLGQRHGSLLRLPMCSVCNYSSSTCHLEAGQHGRMQQRKGQSLCSTSSPPAKAIDPCCDMQRVLI